MKFSDEEDVLRQANDIVYGLAAGIQTNDIKRAHKLARRLKAGSVWINCYHRIETSCPFGGYKMSGYGRENGVGMVQYLTRTKSVAVDLNDFTMDLFASAAPDCRRRRGDDGVSRALARQWVRAGLLGRARGPTIGTPIVGPACAIALELTDPTACACS
jgi:delta 1-pyrroline-5-carboxylate dehydrogenase